MHKCTREYTTTGWQTDGLMCCTSVVMMMMMSEMIPQTTTSTRYRILNIIISANSNNTAPQHQKAVGFIDNGRQQQYLGIPISSSWTYHSISYARVCVCLSFSLGPQFCVLSSWLYGKNRKKSIHFSMSHQVWHHPHTKTYHYITHNGVLVWCYVCMYSPAAHNDIICLCIGYSLQNVWALIFVVLISYDSIILHPLSVSVCSAD